MQPPPQGGGCFVWGETMKARQPAEANLNQRRARRIRIVTTSTVAALTVVMLLAAAWLGTKRISLAPTVLANDPRIRGAYLVPVDGAFELAVELRVEGGAAGETGALLRAERGRFRHVLFGYAEIALLGDDAWIVYVPTRINTDSIRVPLTEFLDSSGVLSGSGAAPPPPGTVGSYLLLPDGVMVVSPGLAPIPDRVPVPEGARRRLLLGIGSDWRYATHVGHFPPELIEVAHALDDRDLTRTSETLLLWRGLQPSSVLGSPPEVEVHGGVGDLLADPHTPPTISLRGVLPLFHPESAPGPQADTP